MKKHRPWLAIMENVENLDDGPPNSCESNIRQVRDMLKEAGFATFVLLMNTADYGLPQIRKGYYIGALALELFQYNVPQAVKTCTQICKCLQADMTMAKQLSVDQCLLDDDDDIVNTEFEHWLSSMQQRDDNSETAWQAKHAAEFEKKGLRWGHAEASEAAQASKWWSVLTAREKDVLVYTQKTEEVAYSVDVGQYLMRHRVQRKPNSLTVMPTEKRWLLDRNRIRTGVESLALQGFPWQAVTLSVDPKTLHSLAGNAWSSTTAMAAFFATIAHIPIPKKTATDGEGSMAVSSME